MNMYGFVHRLPYIEYMAFVALLDSTIKLLDHYCTWIVSLNLRYGSDAMSCMRMKVYMEMEVSPFFLCLMNAVLKYWFWFNLSCCPE
jgi:hypothetical protein